MSTENEVNEKFMKLLTKFCITENLKEFGCKYIIKIYHYKSRHEKGDWVKLVENSVGFCEYVHIIRIL
jgi:peroxiredoxin family protein